MPRTHPTPHRLLFIPVMAVLLVAHGALAQENKTANRIAVLNFSANNTDEGVSRIVRNVVEVNFFKDGSFDILEQTQMDVILKERKQQLKDCREEKCAAKLGELLNANYVIIGSVDKLDIYTVNVKVVDVKTGRIIFTESKDAREIADLKPASVEVTRKIADRIRGKGEKKSVGLKYPICVTVNFLYNIPLGYLKTISRGGYGASLAARVEDIGVKGMHTGLEVQFIYMDGKNTVHHAMMAPILARFGYSVSFWRMTFSPLLSAGITYNINYFYPDNYKIRKARRAGVLFMFRVGAGFELMIVKDFFLRVGADYGSMFEKSGNLQMISCIAGLGVRF